MKETDMKAMIFAAGLGTRLRPLTNDRPKALVEISGKTLLEHCIENLKKQGIKTMVINVHHFASQIIDFLKSKNNFGLEILLSDETDELLDTGGGISKAAPFLKGNEPILIVNVDVLTDLNFQELKKYHLKEQSLATLVVRERETSRYLLFDQTHQLTGWKNIKTGETKISRKDQFHKSNRFAFSGIQIIQPELLDLIEEKGRFSTIDLYLRLAKNHSVKAFIDKESIWMDLGKLGQLEEAEKLIRQMEK